MKNATYLGEMIGNVKQLTIFVGANHLCLLKHKINTLRLKYILYKLNK
jgi:hypothetical protein